MCPIEVILAYTAERGDTPGPFFVTRMAVHLQNVISKMRKALSVVGLEQDKYAGQSFRIGAVTAMAQAGLEDSTIRALVVCTYMCATITGFVFVFIILLYLFEPRLSVSLTLGRS